MNLTIDVFGDTKVVTVVESRLDAAVAGELKDELRYLADDETEAMILNMASVTFIDSSGIGAMVGVMKHMGSDRGFDLCNLCPAVMKLFKLTRMDSVFSIYDTLDQALAANGEHRRTG